MVQHPTPRAGWRGFFATRLWPWMVLAGAIPALLDLLLVQVLGQHLLAWLLVPALAVGPAATWWVRGRGREPTLGFFALFWPLLLVIGWTQATVEVVQGSGLLLTGVYWGWRAWLKLRKLPSAPLGAADKLTISIFLVTGLPGLGASLGGPDAVTQWAWMAVAFALVVLLTVGVVVLGVKGPALLRELAKDTPSWAVSWLRVYSEPSVLVAVSLGYIAVMLTFESLAPHWLTPWLGLIYLSAVVVLTRLLLRPSQGETPFGGRTSTGAPASTPPIPSPSAPPHANTTH